MKQRFSLLSVFLSIITLSACWDTANNELAFNLDFEKVDNGMPQGWTIGVPLKTHRSNNQSNYTVSLDSVTVKSGKYSMLIESTENAAECQGIQFTLPKNYNGEKITLSGYIKTEKVTDGFAGLCLFIEPGIPFDYTLQHEIAGTTDWKKYEITLDLYPDETRQILVGGLLYGKGKIWLDDFEVKVDGKDVRRANPYKPKLFPAEKDKEFEKGTTIEFPDLNDQKIADLELLGRVWGFLKYHHPAIAKGKYNWDNELFRILPAYLNANDHQQRDKILIKWINQYGSIPKCKKYTATPDSTFIKPDISWIEHSNISKKLKTMLQHIHVNRNQGRHYYIRQVPIVGNSIFTHENVYFSNENPDAGLRLLALYRYWNIIYYFFPSTYLTDKDWNVVLKEYIPYFIKAPDRLTYELTTVMLIGEICDTHAFLNGFEEIELERGDKQVPADVQFVENKWVVMKCYTNYTPLKRGDVITHIDGKPVEVIVDSVKKYYPASNEVSRLRNIADDLLRSNNLSIQVDYLSSGETKQKEIYLEARSQIAYYQKRDEYISKCYRFIGEDIGYITLKNIKEEDIPVIKKEFMNAKGIIVDIRNYPSIYSTIHRLVPYFVSETTPFVKLTIGNSDKPGEFSFKEAYKMIKPDSGTKYQGKLVVLVNEQTQSHAEFVAMAFQAGDNTTVIGSQTAGADGNITPVVLPGGLISGISGFGVYYPDGRETQRIGIVPDIEVKPTIQGIREGRDEVLDKAIEFISQE